MIANLYSKYKILIWPILSLFISAVLIVLVIFPQILSFFGTKANIDQTSKRVTLLNQKSTSLSGVDSDSYKKNLDLALLALPADRDYPAAISQIQTLVGINKLELNAISFINTGASAVQSYQVKADIIGSSANLKNFISQIKEAPQIMKLTTAEITFGKNDSNEANLTIEVYFQNPPATLGNIEQPLPALTQGDLALLSNLQQRLKVIPVVSADSVQLSKGKTNPFE